MLRIKFTYTIKNYGPGSAAPKNLIGQQMGKTHDLPTLIS